MPDRDLSELTDPGRFVYDRLTRPNETRKAGDPIRTGKKSYDPCCLSHITGQICLLQHGHDPDETGLWSRIYHYEE